MLYNADKSLAPVTEHHVISVLSQPGNEPPAPKFYGFLRTPRWNSCFRFDTGGIFPGFYFRNKQVSSLEGHSAIDPQVESA